jgi:hypothetical protein
VNYAILVEDPVPGPVGARTQREAVGAMRRLEFCDGFYGRVPPPPIRFAAPYAASERFCRSAVRLSRLADAVVVRQRGSHAAFQDALGVSEEDFSEARMSVRARLRLNRALPVAHGVAEESRLEPLLGKIASKLSVQQHQEVRCWSNDWPTIAREEYAYYGAVAPVRLQAFHDLPPFRRLREGVFETIHLAPEVCRPLVVRGYHSGATVDDLALANALQVLARFSKRYVEITSGELESPSYGGVFYTVECIGLQHAAEAGRLLGIPAVEARRLARLAWEQVYPRLPARYHSPKCRSDGLLDETPGDGVWP